MTETNTNGAHDPLALRGYNPRSVSGPANPDYRYGFMRQALTSANSDLLWLNSQYETARLLLTSAAKLLVSHPSPDATDNFARAMATFHGMASRVATAQRATETALKNCLEGEQEQEHNQRAFTQSIVQGAKRYVVPAKGQ